MSYPIYKVNHLVKDTIVAIYVFSGGEIDDENTVFTKTELEIIQNESINVIYSKQIIQFDDSIRVIKIKILSELMKSREEEKGVSLEEIYLFCQKEVEGLNSAAIYSSLTQNKKHTFITAKQMEQFVFNIISDSDGNEIELPEPANPAGYVFDDIMKMGFDNKGRKFIVNEILGQDKFVLENEYPFVVNPFYVESYDDLFEKKLRKSIASLNGELLMNGGEIIQNNIYLCLADDVLKEQQLDAKAVEMAFRTYYPFLYDKDILDIKTLDDKRDSLIEINKKVLNENTIELFGTVQMLYEMYENKTSNLKYVSSGIKSVKAVLRPEFNIRIPLEYIFKIIHANKTTQLIKHNPSTKQEKVYRLYADKISTDGRKIPYLKKSTIFKLMKEIAKSASVSAFIEYTHDDNQTYSVICEFDDSGYITISSEFKTSMDSDDIDVIFRNAANPVINEVKSFVEQSGYKLNVFDSLYNNMVEIRQMTYETIINVNKAIKLKPIMGCVSSIFNNETRNLTTDVHLRFKRVAYFNKVDSQEAFIVDMINEKGTTPEEIVNKLLANYSELTEGDAQELVQKVANEMRLNNSSRKSEIKIKDNPGFKTTILSNKLNSTITITVENINNINYLRTLPIYLDSLIRLTQEKIKHSCSSQDKEDIETVLVEQEKEKEKKEDEENERHSEIDYDSDIDMLDFLNGNNDSDDDDEQDGGARFKSALFDSDSEEEEELQPQSQPQPQPQPQPQEVFESDSEPDYESESDYESEPESEPESDDDDESPSAAEENDDGGMRGESPAAEDDGGMRGLSPAAQFQSIVGLPLKGKNAYFQSKIKNYEPDLSQSCSSSASERRFPVILTDEELKNVTKTHKLKPEEVVRYGTNTDKQFNYICPRYWCLKTNTIINPSELKDSGLKDKIGKPILEHPTCGKVLPSYEDNVKDGYYIYEFTQPGKEYKKRYPGFQIDSNTKGSCLPCCFNKFDTPGMIKNKKQCVREDTGAESAAAKKGSEKNKLQNIWVEYINGPDKYPLEPGRWGYLPQPLQIMLRQVNADCQISKTNTNLKKGHPCLLRIGVENNKNQSFVACIATIRDLKRRDTEISSIQKIKEDIIESLTIDNFIKYQNGNLVTNFSNMYETKTAQVVPVVNVDKDIYTNSELYKKIKTDEEQYYFKRVVSAFENFTEFLRNEDSVIDHTYLWDIVSLPNDALFTTGINLVIFQISSDGDATNNRLQLLCPSNHYSNQYYDSAKPTVMLMKHGDYYEPIFSYVDMDTKRKSNDSNKLKINKFFKESDKDLSNTMRAVLSEIIKPNLKSCMPLDSMPAVYKEKRPLLLYNLKEQLDKVKYSISKLVINFNGKVIGVIAEYSRNKTSCFVPCFPSAIDESLSKTLDYVFMTDKTLWKSYDETFDFLANLNDKSISKSKDKDKDTTSGGIPCMPQYKVVDDKDMVVGILTETNQFIQISKKIPEDKISAKRNIPSLKNNNYMYNELVSSDVKVMTTTDVDNERVDYVKKLKLETNFYNVFRNTIRMSLNTSDSNHIKMREEIESLLNNNTILYSNKLIQLDDLLRKLVGDKVTFSGDEKYYELVDEVSNCVDQCTNNKVCVINDETGKCVLILPEKNLITDKPNESIYYGRISDELLRYSRIKSFMFQPQSYISFGDVGYNLNDDEVILLESILTQEYFDTMVPSITQKYIKSNTFDDATPSSSVSYKNEVVLATNENKVDIACEPVVKPITSSIWKNIFPNSYKEVSYNYGICTFNIIKNLTETIIGKKVSTADIKLKLFEEYLRIDNDKNRDNILDILYMEGKKTLVDQVRGKSITLKQMIYNDKYYFTTFDLWLLVNAYSIPTIFISQKKILQTSYTNFAFVGKESSDKDNAYAFIYVPVLKAGVIPTFKLIQMEPNKYSIPIQDIYDIEEVDILQTALRETVSISEYLDNFVKIAKPIKHKKRLDEGEYMLDEDEEEE